MPPLFTKLHFEAKCPFTSWNDPRTAASGSTLENRENCSRSLVARVLLLRRAVARLGFFRAYRHAHETDRDHAPLDVIAFAAVRVPVRAKELTADRQDRRL